MKSVVRLTDLLDMTRVVDWDIKQHSNKLTVIEMFLLSDSVEMIRDGQKPQEAGWQGVEDSPGQ